MHRLVSIVLWYWGSGCRYRDELKNLTDPLSILYVTLQRLAT
jgi:hypothetical protein